LGHFTDQNSDDGIPTGRAWEGIVVHQGWLHYQGTTGYHALAWWMLIFWMAVGALMNGALSGLKGHPVRSMLLGSCFGPLFAMVGENMAFSPSLMQVMDFSRWPSGGRLFFASCQIDPEIRQF